MIIDDTRRGSITLIVVCSLAMLLFIALRVWESARILLNIALKKEAIAQQYYATQGALTMAIAHAQDMSKTGTIISLQKLISFHLENGDYECVIEVQPCQSNELNIISCRASLQKDHRVVRLHSCKLYCTSENSHHIGEWRAS